MAASRILQRSCGDSQNGTPDFDDDLRNQVLAIACRRPAPPTAMTAPPTHMTAAHSVPFSLSRGERIAGFAHTLRNISTFAGVPGWHLMIPAPVRAEDR